MPTLVFTGGHHTSALAVANYLQKRGWDIIWFGHKKSMWGDANDSAEYQDVTSFNITFYDLKAGKLSASLHPLQLARIPWGFVQAFSWLFKLKVSLGSNLAGIVSFGGYLSVPTVLSGWLLGIPSLTHEQTTSAGFANRLLSHFVKKIALTWPESQPYFDKSKTILVGLPLRTNFVKNLTGRLKKTTPSPKTIFVTGGKQGSHVINETLFSLVPVLSRDFHIIHQTGTNSLYHDLTIATSLHTKFPNYLPFGFDSHKFSSAISTCDVCISRAGAHTVYELGVMGVRSVLIPLPNSSNHEQDQNARMLMRHGLAVILPQSDLSPTSLTHAISQALSLTPQPIDLPRDSAKHMANLITTTFSS